MTLPNLLLFSLGVAALALPLWVHLRMGRTRKRAKVSSLHLLLAAPQSSLQPRRLVNIPLFLLRCLLLLLLALAFGRWLIPSFGGSTRQAYAVLVIDVSASMRAIHDGKPVWETARNQALETLDDLAADSRVALMPSPSHGIRPAWESPAETRQRLLTLHPGFGENKLAADLLSAVRLLESMPTDRAKLMHVISDFQRNSLAGLDQLTLPASIETHAAKSGPLTAANRGMAIEVMPAGAMDIGFYGFSDGSNGEILIKENERSTPWQVTPGRSATRIAPTDKDGAWVARTLSFEADPANDALREDNTGYDCFPNPSPIRAWLIEAPSRPGQTAIYQQPAYFLRIALQPGLENEAFRTSRYEPVVVKSADVTVPAADKLPQLLVITALPSLPDSVAQLAQSVVTSGGAVVFFTGPDLATTEYTQKLGNLLPVSIGNPTAFPPGSSLESIDSRHPLWGTLDSETRRELPHIGLRQGHTLTPTPGTRVLAYDASAHPFLVERRIGPGGTYFVNTSADRTWGDWPAKSALFVPSIHLLCARALGADAFKALHAPWLAGQANTLDLGKQFAQSTVTIAGKPHATNDLGQIQDLIFDQPGLYDVTSSTGTLLQRIAVNIPTSESNLDSFAGSVVNQRLSSLRTSGSQPVQRWANDTEAGSLAWKLCLALIPFLLLVEPLLIHRPRT